MKKNIWILFIAIFLLSACGAGANSESVSIAPAAGAPEMQKGGPAPMPGVSSAPPAAPSVSDAVSPAAVNTGQVSSNNSVQRRIVIQNADLAIVVTDPQAKLAEITKLAERLGGYVVSSNMSQVTIGENGKVPEGSVSIRVPAKNLDTALAEIKTNIVEVQSENRTGQDVTDQYVDLQSQLKAKEAAAVKLYEIMDKTQKADDTLLVFNQLTQVQSDIEVLKGQINYYDQAAALSELNVRLIAEQSAQPIVVGGWKPQGVAKDAVQALIDFFQGFASFLIWLIIFVIPTGAVLIFMLSILWRLLRWFWKKVFPKQAA
ncbi:MAG: DUF4349 domain-containing protein, partial [Chloroflexota bacterium]